LNFFFENNCLLWGLIGEVIAHALYLRRAEIDNKRDFAARAGVDHSNFTGVSVKVLGSFLNT